VAGVKEMIAAVYATQWQQENKLLTQNVPCGITMVFLKNATLYIR
jgi:hypothetical protein